MKLVLFKARDGWRVRVQWSNGLIFATTEAYYHKSNALRAASRACRQMRVKVWIEEKR